MSNRHGAALSLLALLALLTLATASTVAVARDPPASPQVELTGFAVFPADSFTAGPPSGQYTDQGRRLPAARFAAQPVQGISSVQPGPEPGTWWALSDNGFGARANSFDYRLALYLFAAAPGSGPETGKVELRRRIELRDPQAHFPWRLAEESLPGRPLTGADADPESLVVMPDGSFWIGDEHGPWLLHFSPAGDLLAPPVELRVAGVTVRSAVHPEVLAGSASAALKASRGFEGLAPGPRPGTLLAMLEGPLPEDGPDELRLLEFDLARGDWTGRDWRYRLADPGNAATELVVAGSRFLVIERDGLQGDAARFKRILSIELGEVAQPVARTLEVDLLQIDDPRQLGGGASVFRFPFWTPESVQWLGDGTLLVVNDNNFPATGGRSSTARDPTEWIWLRLPAAARE